MRSMNNFVHYSFSVTQCKHFNITRDEFSDYRSFILNDWLTNFCFDYYQLHLTLESLVITLRCDHLVG